MNLNKYLFLLVSFIFIIQIQSSFIPNECIEEIKISKLENTKIKQQSTIYTDENYSTIKFFKIDLNSIPDLTDAKIFSFIKISIKPVKRNSYKIFALYINKTLYDFQDSTEYIIDYNIQDKHPTTFIPKKYYKLSKFFYFFVQSEKNAEFEYIIETFMTDIYILDMENKFYILFKPGKIDLNYKIQEDIPKGYLLFGVITTGVIEDGKDLYLDIICRNKNGGNYSIGKYYPYFINGIGSLVTDKEIIECKNINDNIEDNDIFIKITLYNDLSQILDVEFISHFLEIKNNNEFTSMEIYENSIYTSVLLGKNDINKQCFKFKQYLENREMFYSYDFNIRSTCSDLKITYYSGENSSNSKNKKIFFTGFMKLKINEENEYNYICIENNKAYSTGIQFQINQKLKKNFSNFYKMPLLPLINGFPTYFKIGKGESMIYKVDLRQFQRNDDDKKYSKKYVQNHLIKLNQAEIHFHHLQCKKFSNDYNDENVCKNINNNEFKMQSDLYMDYEYPNYNSLYFNEYLLVSCEDAKNDCKYLLDINLLSEKESYPTQLIYNNDELCMDFHYKPISKNGIHKYKISLSNKLKSDSKLYVILYMFGGDADLSIYDYNDSESNKDLKRVIQDIKYTSIGKKKYLVYNINTNNNYLNYNLREIILKITCLSSGFYSLKYYTVNSDESINKINFSFPVGEINMDKLTFGERERIYTLSSLLSKSHSQEESNSEFYININSLNCILEVEFINQKYINRDIQIFFKENDIKHNNLKIKLFELDSQNKDKEELCIYYIMSNPFDPQKNIITVNEAVVHTMNLDDKLESIVYRYPYTFNDNIVSISLYKFFKDDIEVKVDLNGVYTTHELTMKNIHFKKLVIYLNTLQQHCLKNGRAVSQYYDLINLCPINISIKLAKKNQNKNRFNRIQLEVLSNGKTPTYIKNGEIRFDSVIVSEAINGNSNNNYVYYYSDIGKNEYPSEIIINTKFGVCEAVAKIIQKKKIDMLPNWDRRVRLPTYDDNDKTDYIKYDYELNKFIINRKDLEKCENGCEIYIGVFSRDKSVYLQINDFIIMFLKNYKKEPMKLIFNQNVDDSITKYIDTKYYISHLEYENINKLVFTFNSNYCSLCIIMKDENEKYDLNKLDKCEWKLDNIVNGYKNYMLTIKSTDNKLQGKDLTSIKFISKIYSQIRNNKDKLYYSLKINKQINNLPMIINVDSINNEIAQIDYETGLAYYAIRVQEYQTIYEIDLCVISDEKIINDNLVLYAKLIGQDEYDKEGLNEKLFKEDYKDYQIKSDEKVMFKNHLNIKIFHSYKKGEDKIIFLVVKCNSINKVDPIMNHYVKILTMFYKPNTNISLKKNNLNFYNLQYQSPKFMIPLTPNKYSIVVINCLYGEGTININFQKEYNIYNDDYNSFNLENCINKEYKIVLDVNDTYNTNYNMERLQSIKVKNRKYNVEKKNSFYFYISYYNKNINNNIEFIDINKENIIFYPIINNIKQHKSLSYYLNINQLVKEDLLIEITFNNKYVKNVEHLNILSAVINEEFIYENVINEQQVVFSPLYGQNYYNEKNKAIYILFKKGDINKYKSNFGYVLISIINNYFNYEHIMINLNVNYLYVKIKVIPYENSLIYDSVEIKNKYIGKGKNDEINTERNKKNINNNEKYNKRFISNSVIVFLVVLFVIILLLLFIRWTKRKNAINTINYFNQDIPILK